MLTVLGIVTGWSILLLAVMYLSEKMPAFDAWCARILAPEIEPDMCEDCAGGIGGPGVCPCYEEVEASDLMGRPGCWRIDPRGAHVTWKVRDRIYLCEVTGLYMREGTSPGWMLQTRHFNGEPGPDVAAGAVRFLVRTYEEEA